MASSLSNLVEDLAVGIQKIKRKYGQNNIKYKMCRIQGLRVLS